jgi:hypothetical protein
MSSRFGHFPGSQRARCRTTCTSSDRSWSCEYLPQRRDAILLMNLQRHTHCGPCVFVSEFHVRHRRSVHSQSLVSRRRGSVRHLSDMRDHIKRVSLFMDTEELRECHGVWTSSDITWRACCRIAGGKGRDWIDSQHRSSIGNACNRHTTHRSHRSHRAGGEGYWRFCHVWQWSFV